MNMSINTLRPGLLVSLKTACRGNVKYDKLDIEREHSTEEGSEVAKWETTRTISDPIEFEAARKAQSRATSIIRSCCTMSAFGLLCPERDADLLDRSISDARKVVDEFNATASLTHVSVYIMTGRIAQDDVEAVRAINSEVRQLLDTMATGVSRLDVKLIRDAAGKAKQLGNMLSSDAQARVQIAIESARAAAKKIVAAGEAAAVEVDQLAMRRITEQRTAFLDLDDAFDTVSVQEAPARSLDFVPVE